MTPRLFYFCTNYNKSCEKVTEIQDVFNKHLTLKEGVICVEDVKEAVSFNAVIKDTEPICVDCDDFPTGH